MATPDGFRLEEFIRNVPDFPKAGIQFKDITPLLADPMAFRVAIRGLADRYRDERIDAIAAAEARGFLIAAPMALELGVGLVPIRKPGKLPSATMSAEYALEYGTDRVEMHRDALAPGRRVLIVDDVLATGGTMSACIELVREAGAEVIGCAFLIELSVLDGRSKLGPVDIFSLMTY